MLGTAMGGGSMNVQGEEQQKLDVYANEVIINVLRLALVGIAVSLCPANVIMSSPQDFLFDVLPGF